MDIIESGMKARCGVEDLGYLAIVIFSGEV